MTTGIDAITCKVIVLDANIASMTKFKQIIGRGTRINEDYDKKYFTIIDFRNATDLFADPDFDGEPIQIKEVSNDVDITDIELPDVDFPPDVELQPEPPLPPDELSEPPHTRLKVYVNGVDVSILISRELYFDHHGKLITTSLKDHTREIIRGQFASLDDFISKWNSSDKKTVLIEELKQQGILVEALYKAVNKELDLFDLICHVAYDQPPLTRKERAENVKKRNYFTKYSEQARKVIENLLDKYADEGIDDIESMEVLKVKPFTNFGSPVEIIRAFGNKNIYLQAINELEKALYQSA
jgi:type I restriction enzyme R subunit